MRATAATWGLAVIILTGGRLPATAATPGPCSHDTLAVEGAPLTITLCAEPHGPPKPDAPLTVTTVESFATPRASFTRTAQLQFSAGDQASRTIDNVALLPLGIGKTLHMALRYQSGDVRLEHALLLPGAVPLK
jgi:hypothetical protein